MKRKKEKIPVQVYFSFEDYKKIKRQAERENIRFLATWLRKAALDRVAEK